MNRVQELENLLKALDMQSEDICDAIRELKIKQIEISKHITHVEKEIELLKRRKAVHYD